MGPGAFGLILALGLYAAPKGGAWLLAICGSDVEVEFLQQRVLCGRVDCRSRRLLGSPGAAPTAAEPVAARDAMASHVAPSGGPPSGVPPPPTAGSSTA